MFRLHEGEEVLVLGRRRRPADLFWNCFQVGDLAGSTWRSAFLIIAVRENVTVKIVANYRKMELFCKLRVFFG